MKYELLLSLNLPRRNPFFTDREGILKLLDDRLSADHAAIRTQAICGLGGIGKTQVAIEYAYRFRNSYRAVLWADAHSRETLSAAMGTIADQLGLNERGEQDPSPAVVAVKQWLGNQPHWLLILDNVEDETIVRDFMLPSSNGRLLLTTQASTIEKIAQICVLDKLTDEDGALLLLRRAKIIPQNARLDQALSRDRKEALEIACRMGGLPLALDQAGAYIEETECGLPGYLDRYETQRQFLLDRRGGFLSGEFESSDHPASVVTTFSLSVERAENADTLAGDILRLCAFLYPDGIPNEIIAGGVPALSHIHPSYTVTSAQVVDAVNILCKFSLLNRDVNKDTLSMHPLLHTVLQDEMDETTKDLWAQCAVLTVSKTFPPIDFTTWVRCEIYLPQALVCIDLMQRWDMESSKTKDFALEAAHLLHETAFYLFERASYEKVEDFYRRALSIHEKIVGPNSSEVATDVHRLALFYRALGRYSEAEALFRHALHIREQTLGLEDALTANSWYELGRIYSIQGKYREAEDPFRRALKIRERALPPKHADITASLNELGWLYRHLGSYQMAEELLSRALAMREETLDAGDPRIAQTLYFLAWLSYDTGKSNRAESLLLRSLAIREQALGSNHPHVAQSLNSLGLLYCSEGKYARSESFYQRALAIRTQKFGQEHPLVAETLDNLALLYYHQGKFSQSESLYQQALDIRRKVLKPDHLDITHTLNNLGRLYFAQKKYDLAEAFLLEALLTREQTFGREHPYVANSLHYLADVYTAQHKYSQAEEMYQRVLAIREQALESEHLDLAQTLNSLAELYVVQGRYEEAQRSYEKAITIYDQSRLADHPNAAVMFKNYAHLLRKMGHNSEAIEIESRASAIRNKDAE